MGSYAPSVDLNPFLRDPIAGDRLSTSLGPSGSGVVIVDQQCYFTWYDVYTPFILASIALDVSVVGGAGALLRAGLYRDDGSGLLPSELIADLGTQQADAGIGNRVFPYGLQVPRGRLWIAVVGQGAPAPSPTVRCTTIFGASIYNPLGTSVANFYPRQIPVAGALPNPAVATSGHANFAPTVTLVVG